MNLDLSITNDERTETHVVTAQCKTCDVRVKLAFSWLPGDWRRALAIIGEAVLDRLDGEGCSCAHHP